MRSALALLTLAGSAAAQAVTGLIVPSSVPPAGCTNSRAQPFQLSIVNASVPAAAAASPSGAQKRDDAALFARQDAQGHLTMTIVGGVLKDSRGRTGYVASNYQFQFDGPPQAGAIYTAGFSVCANNSIALGGNAIWWSCNSGAFSNLYDRNWAPQCKPVYFQAVGGGAAFSTAPPGPESTGPDQATIANGGGTQSMASLPTSSPALNASMPSSNLSMTAVGPTSTSASASGTGHVAAVTSSPATGAAPSMAYHAPRALLSLGMGVMGAMVLL